jgi:hypothetical protein
MKKNLTGSHTFIKASTKGEQFSKYTIGQTNTAPASILVTAWDSVPTRLATRVAVPCINTKKALYFR